MLSNGTVIAESCWEDLCLVNIDSSGWGVLLEIFLLVYSFIGLAIACDDFLVKSLETLAARWNVKEDVAGAQFLALGSAAPEITISAITTIKGNNHVGLGMGAILGSGLIANLLIPGCIVLAMKEKELRIKRRPLFRDFLFYAIGFVLLTYIVHEADLTVDVSDAGFLLVVYAIYIVVLHWSPRIRRWWRKRQGKIPHGHIQENFVRASKANLLSPSEKVLLVNDTEIPKELSVVKSYTEEDERWAQDITHSDDDDDDDEEQPSWWQSYFDAFVYPLRLMFKWTCIDCELDGPYEKWYLVTFFVSVFWVALFSFVISAVISSFVRITGVSNHFFGVTLVALSAEIPDTIQSISVARRGYASMAMSNFLGSQIINICIGIGLPYFIVALLKRPVHFLPGGVDHEVVALGCAILVHSVLLLGLSWREHSGKAILNKKKGVFLLICYIAVITMLAILQFTGVTK